MSYTISSLAADNRIDLVHNNVLSFQRQIVQTGVERRCQLYSPSPARMALILPTFPLLICVLVRHLHTPLKQDRFFTIIIRPDSFYVDSGLPLSKLFAVTLVVKRNISLVFGNSIHQRVELPLRSATHATPSTKFAAAAFSLGRVIGVFADESWSDVFEEAAECRETGTNDEEVGLDEAVGGCQQEV